MAAKKKTYKIGTHPNSLKNLQKGETTPFTKENAKAIGAKGLATQKKQRETKKTLQQLAKILLNQEPLENEKKLLEKVGLSAEQIGNSRKGLIIFQSVSKAVKNGDLDALAKLGELSGEYIPTQKILTPDQKDRPIVNLVKPKPPDKKKEG